MENKTETTKNIIDTFAKSGISGLLIFVIIFFGSRFVQKLTVIQTDLEKIKIELVKVQNTIIDRGEIEKMIENAINLHEAKKHHTQ